MSGWLSIVELSGEVGWAVFVDGERWVSFVYNPDDYQDEP